MRHYENQTDGLRHCLRLWSKDAVASASFPTQISKLETLSEKFAEAFGTNLPSHIRHARRKAGQPNAYAFAHRFAGAPANMCWVWLMRTDGDLGPVGSDWQRESWNTSPPQIGSAETRLKITKEPRPRGDYAWTWRLGDRHLNMVGSEWRDHVVAGRGDELKFAVEQAGSSLPMFGGIRRQLTKELELQKRRWRKLHPRRPWPNIPSLPRMGKFNR